MIKISRLADYALVVLSYLIEAPRCCYSAAVLAERTTLSVPTVSKVLKLLNEAKLVTSVRGVNGGYRLVKEPEQMNLVEVISAVDGVPALTECCLPKNQCVHDSHCQMRSQWQLINRVIIQVLSQFSMADLKKPAIFDVDIPKALSRGVEHV